MAPIGSLEQAVAFRDPEVIETICADWAVSEEDAEALFCDVRQFLWLAAKLGREGVSEISFIGQPWLSILDEVWHCFILCTRSYERFCRECLGGFLDHTPSPPTRKRKRMATADTSPDVLDQKIRSDLRAAITSVMTELGEATAERWFGLLPRQYPLGALESLRRPLA